ncbi:glycerol kinase GlpK [Pelagibacterium halotolerans]|uniref:Glycerol kinase n=1 Tax=Pelagibacterium halotolerans (strain DSM 22347 / JCM 15775 / CGMCC 1.7692 / B2) TaxID=1082931 RepID=G4RA95_PELHB|nr:glycerol kinase GlpK [Pelagibacterium halotolerans]AEQ50454.1 glycerol kinase [Pelagibacterium halotolerans B2]QJR19583.1 glycerol kinase GlpK [Pelagibacterium halotolerans]SDZ87405.1 glycerol kinase [Pelagibacterium halotolerans]
MGSHILAIDQGTTSSRALVFDKAMKVAGQGQKEFAQHFPQSGWVEHDPEDIWESVISSVRSALKRARLSADDIAAIGITNQRETTLVWDRKSGKPIHRAIVWQDRRTSDICNALKSAGKESLVSQKTGLLLDPYFSGTKIKWLLDSVEGARRRAEAGELAFGTMDTYLIWRLTGGAVHATDATNASRTLLFDIEKNAWDDELLALMDVPAAMLPEVRDCDGDFGRTDAAIFGRQIPIRGVAGDQHAAVIGQACFTPGMIKSTYGTGCFAVLNTGDTQVRSQNRLLTTIAYRLGGKTTYALEGSIFVAGAAVQWLRDGLKIIGKASDSGRLALGADPKQSVYLVPAFVGLGAPYWDAEARGAMFGLTRNTGPEELARAALEAVCYQTADLLDAMHKDWNSRGAATVLRVDGGMVASDYMMQFLADILDAPIDRPHMLETTVLGAAWLAGQAIGMWPDQTAFSRSWALEHQFVPEMDEAVRNEKLAGWHDAVSRTISER